MPVTKTKKPRRAKAANSPVPCGPGSTCGHSGCKDTCKIRYVGPTSHPRDHHALEAAQGAKHVWTASIVAGLAVVLTGTIAFSAVDASSQQSKLTEKQLMLQRIGKVEALVNDLNKQAASQSEPETGIDPACIQTCRNAQTVCADTAYGDTDLASSCTEEYEICVNDCEAQAGIR